MDIYECNADTEIISKCIGGILNDFSIYLSVGYDIQNR